MSKTDISKAKNPDMHASMAALKHAAAQARNIAMQTNTSIVLVENGTLVKVSAEQLRQQIHKR